MNFQVTRTGKSYTVASATHIIENDYAEPKKFRSESSANKAAAAASAGTRLAQGFVCRK